MSSGLNSLKCKVDKLDLDKLVPVSVDLTELSDVVKTNVAKKDISIRKFENRRNNILAQSLGISI